MNRLIKHLLRLKFAGELAGFVFSWATYLIPVKWLGESETRMAIVHSKSSYPIPIVLLPKRKIKNWLSLPMEDPQLYSEFIEMTQGMIRDFYLEEAGYQLIVNGGKNQTFPHLHVHLIAGNAY